MTACHCMTAPAPTHRHSAGSVLVTCQRLRHPVHRFLLFSRQTRASAEVAFLLTGSLSISVKLKVGLSQTFFSPDILAQVVTVNYTWFWL